MKNKLLIKLGNIFNELGFNIYLVGGGVRDFLLGKDYSDYDFVTDALVSEVKLIFPEGNYNFAKFGVSQIKINNEIVDIATLRKEKYDLNKRKPSEISFTKSLLEDSMRRDFTINALYMDKEGNIYDFHQGLEDLDNKTIRMIGDIDTRMNEDPLRILRCLRFKMMLDFAIEEELDQYIRNNLSLLNEISLVLINQEIVKMKNISLEKFIKIVKEYSLEKYIVCDELVKREYNVIDLHCDTITKCYKQNKELINNDLHIDINKLIKGQYLLQCFALFINLKDGDPYQNFLKYYDFYLNQLQKNKHYLTPVLSYQDLLNVKSSSKIGAMLTIEEGDVLQNDLSRLDELYLKGVRMITLTWNYPNCIGQGNVKQGIDFFDNVIDEENGLTDFGKQVVTKMNELGMIIDVSHLSDKGFYDVINLSTQPVVASHSNTRFIQNVVRNLSDEMILLLHKNNGVMGINYCASFVGEDNYLDQLVNHIKHIKEIGCIDNICLGSDFDGIETPNELIDASKINFLYTKLVEKGFTKLEIEKIFFKNFIRVMKNVLK